MSSLQKFHRRTQPFKVNTLHTGTVSISGTAIRNQVLTASNNIADADGLGTFAYQWKRSGTAISGATSSTYTLDYADIANTITVTITYTDGKGFTETETSAATATVADLPNDSVSITTSGDGSGNDSAGYYLAGYSDGKKMYVAPKSTEIAAQWAPSNGIVRGTTLVNNGLGNTNTLHAIGSYLHPAAYYCKNLTTGGYNTWYLPAKNELMMLISNQNKTPFGTNNKFNTGFYVWSSSEVDPTNAWSVRWSTGLLYNGGNKTNTFNVRAVRRAY